MKGARNERLLHARRRVLLGRRLLLNEVPARRSAGPAPVSLVYGIGVEQYVVSAPKGPPHWSVCWNWFTWLKSFTLSG